MDASQETKIKKSLKKADYELDFFPALKASRMRTAVKMSSAGTLAAASKSIFRSGSRRRDSRRAQIS